MSLQPSSRCDVPDNMRVVNGYLVGFLAEYVSGFFEIVVQLQLKHCITFSPVHHTLPATTWKCRVTTILEAIRKRSSCFGSCWHRRRCWSMRLMCWRIQWQTPNSQQRKRKIEQPLVASANGHWHWVPMLWICSFVAGLGCCWNY